MNTVAERVLRDSGVGRETTLELIALVREGRMDAAWDFFMMLYPDVKKRAIVVNMAVARYAFYKKNNSLDDTSILIEKCLQYMK